VKLGRRGGERSALRHKRSPRLGKGDGKGGRARRGWNGCTGEEQKQSVASSNLQNLQVAFNLKTLIKLVQPGQIPALGLGPLLFLQWRLVLVLTWTWSMQAKKQKGGSELYRTAGTVGIASGRYRQ